MNWLKMGTKKNFSECNDEELSVLRNIRLFPDHWDNQQHLKVCPILLIWSDILENGRYKHISYLKYFVNTYQAYRKQAETILCRPMINNGVPSLLFSLFPFVLVPELRWEPAGGRGWEDGKQRWVHAQNKTKH